MDYSKWIMAHSRTWWIGVLQIALGMALAVFANVDTLTTLHGILNDMTGGIGPYGLITAGFALITIRSAL